MSWLILIIVAFVFLALGSALFVFLIFIHNNGATFGLGILFFLVFLALMSVLAISWSGEVWQAIGVAAAILFLLLCFAAHFFLPCIDNNDAIAAFRPIILFSLAAGLLIVVINLAKIFIA